MMASTAADLLEEVKKREKEVGVEVDWSVDAMLNSEALSGAQESVATEFIIHMLGLDICATTIIGNAMKRGVSGGQKKRVTTGAYSCTPSCETPFPPPMSSRLLLELCVSDAILLHVYL